VDVGAVVDQPLCDGEALRTRSTPAVGHPGEWSFLAVAARTLVEVQVGSHEGFDAFEVASRDGLSNLTHRFEAVDIVLEFGPAWETILTSDLELSGGQGGSCAGPDESLSLVAKIPEVGTIGKLHERNPFHCPVSA
jgi:hypothetical protein